MSVCKTTRTETKNMKQYLGKLLLRTLILIALFLCTSSMSSLQAQFKTIFNPPIFNPTDPGNTDWNEPKNWSWYPGNNVSDNIIIQINTSADNYVQLNIPSSTVIQIMPNAELRVHAVLENKGRISGEGALNLITPEARSDLNYGSINCKSLKSNSIVNYGTIACDFLDLEFVRGGTDISVAGRVICNVDCYVNSLMTSRHAVFENNGNLRGAVGMEIAGNFINKGDFVGGITARSIFTIVKNYGNIEINSPVRSRLASLENMLGAEIKTNSILEIGGRSRNMGKIVNNAEMYIMRLFVNGEQYLNNTGIITNNSLNMTIKEDITFNNSKGIINGVGTVTSSNLFTNTGTLSPGNSPGELNHTGNYTESGTLEIEIGGTSAGSSYDVHSILGSYSSSSATLNVSLIDGFIPEAGNSFRIVNASSRTGNFSSVNLPSLPPGLEWKIDYNPQDITLRVASLVVPVTWLDFTVSADKRNENHVALVWSTAEEIDNLGFDIERSADGRMWEQIGFQEAQSKSADQYDYEYVDLRPNEGLNYYRLKQIDYDGAYDYSIVRSIDFKGSKSTLSVYPNPSDDGMLNFTIENETGSLYELNIFDFRARNVYTQKVNMKKGSNQISINTPDLSPGTYIISMSSGQQQSQAKWVKL